MDGPLSMFCSFRSVASSIVRRGARACPSLPRTAAATALIPARPSLPHGRSPTTTENVAAGPMRFRLRICAMTLSGILSGSGVEWEAKKENPSKPRPSFLAASFNIAVLKSTVHLVCCCRWGGEAKVTSSIMMYVALLCCTSLCHPCFGSRPEVCHGSGYAESPCVFDSRVISNVTHFCAENRISLEEGHVCRRCLMDQHLPNLVAVTCISKSDVEFRLPGKAHSCLAFAFIRV